MSTQPPVIVCDVCGATDHNGNWHRRYKPVAEPYDDWSATKYLCATIVCFSILAIALILAAVWSPNPNPKGLPSAPTTIQVPGK